MNDLSILPNDNAIPEKPPMSVLDILLPPPVKPLVVKVVDFEMSFGNMVLFMIKWAFAAIPAVIIIFAVTMFLFAAFGVFSVLGLSALSSGLSPSPSPSPTPITRSR